MTEDILNVFVPLLVLVVGILIVALVADIRSEEKDDND